MEPRMAKRPKKNTWHGGSRKTAKPTAKSAAVQTSAVPSAPSTPAAVRRQSHPPEAKLDRPDFNPAMLGEQDAYLFNEGRHLRLYEKLGAHPARVGGVDGVYFAVWAPSAEYVAVIGD